MGITVKKHKITEKGEEKTKIYEENRENVRIITGKTKNKF